MIKSLLDEQANNAVGVEDEIGAVCVLVTDDAVENKDVSVRVHLESAKLKHRACNIRKKGDQLRSLREDVHVGMVDLC